MNRSKLFQSKVKDAVHLLISDMPLLGEVSKREDSPIHLTDIEKYSQMIPRFLPSLKDLRKSSQSL